jgi:hypothetical protein
MHVVGGTDYLADVLFMVVFFLKPSKKSKTTC